jgi:methylenetetrahydrofolate reductase (NADH)
MTDGLTPPLARPGQVDARTIAVTGTIADFLGRASLEVTQPTAAEVAEIASICRPGTELFISDIPRRTAADAVETCARIVASGLIPVPHVAVRRMTSLAEFERFVADCVDRGGARKMMLVGGDYDKPAGPFADVASALSGGAVKRLGITEISIAAYPEGHRRIVSDALRAALDKKRDILTSQGLAVRVVTQFGFNRDATTRFILRLRQSGFGGPIRAGIAGPASAATLARFAIRCGVLTVSRIFLRNSAQIGGAIAGYRPESFVKTLADFARDPRIGDVSPHLYSFGGGSRTAFWIHSVQNGEFQAYD